MTFCILEYRGVVRLSGADARQLLGGLVTAEVAHVGGERAAFAALLTPQGKIVADFFIAAEDEQGLLLDCPAELAASLAQKLGFYKLRAKATVENVSGQFAVAAVWDGAAIPVPDCVSFPDPRLTAMGQRLLIPAARKDSVLAALRAADGASDAAAYETHRIACGVPRGGADFLYGDTFPHEADMDQLHGVDFKKGCYVGQEVVSRMQHRGTARTRIVPVRFSGPAPSIGTPVFAGDKEAGRFGSSADGRGLALLRLDRAADALSAGAALTAGGIALDLVRPDWAAFAWPTGGVAPVAAS